MRFKNIAADNNGTSTTEKVAIYSYVDSLLYHRVGSVVLARQMENIIILLYKRLTWAFVSGFVFCVVAANARPISMYC